MLIQSRRRHHDPLSCGIFGGHELLHRVDLPAADPGKVARPGSGSRRKVKFEKMEDMLH